MFWCLKELGLVSDQHDESKGKTILGSSGIVHEVAIGAMRAFGSKEGETMKNIAPSDSLYCEFFSIQGTLEIDINTFSKETGFPLEKGLLGSETTPPLKT